MRIEAQPLFVSAEDLLARADPLRMVAAMEASLVAMSTDDLLLPARLHLEARGSTLLVMPSAGEGLYAIKLVTVAEHNAARGQPRIQGLVVLLSTQTGAPIAVIDAGVLTGQRTGAIAAIGIKQMCAPETKTLGIVGTGVQGAWAAIHASAVRPIVRLFCYARSSQSFDAFSGRVRRFAPQLELISCAEPRQVLQAAECVITATTACAPVLPNDPKLLEGKALISIGSFRPSMQELPDEAYALAGAMIVDSPQATLEVGDVINPVKTGLISPENVIQLSDIIIKKASLPLTSTRIFKSVGHSAFDLFAAKAAVDQLSEQPFHYDR